MGLQGQGAKGSKEAGGSCGYWMGSHESFAEENEIVYHIDGVITTHTGEIKG